LFKLHLTISLAALVEKGLLVYISVYQIGLIWLFFMKQYI